MVEHSRYSVSQEESGVENDVLKNKLDIQDQKRLENIETILLQDTYLRCFYLLLEGKITFDLSLFFSIHKYFLEKLYTWAGKVRTVDISKGGLLFAPVMHIHSSLKTFKKILAENIPQSNDSKTKIASQLAIIHNEFNAIHPFREGNGRTLRLFLDLLVTHLGYEPIDWSKTSGEKYIEACRDGMARRHESLEKMIIKGLKKTTISN